METTGGLDVEVVIADDASTDGSVDRVKGIFPFVRATRSRRRLGGPATKDRGARHARGEVLVFLDGHCKPERWAIERLVNAVEDLETDAIVTPRVPSLDCELWENSPTQVGFGYRMRLDAFECAWIELEEMERREGLYECPALIGCCMAVRKRLYDTLRGFDRHMLQWGVEDIDLGLKSWLMGHPVLHNPHAVIGHRFQRTFDNFEVAREAVLSNQIRMARKNFTDRSWEDWVARTRAREPALVWVAAWKLFEGGRRSVERERAYLFRHRVHDERWYARRFGLDWPQE